jgi:hypothetical protein
MNHHWSPLNHHWITSRHQTIDSPFPTLPVCRQLDRNNKIRDKGLPDRYRRSVFSSQTCHLKWVPGTGEIATWNFNPEKNNMIIYKTGWWFGTFFMFPYILRIVIPTDFHIFSEGAKPPTRKCGAAYFQMNRRAGRCRKHNQQNSVWTKKKGGFDLFHLVCINNGRLCQRNSRWKRSEVLQDRRCLAKNNAFI